MMKYLTILLAVAGLAYGALTVVRSRILPPNQPLVALPPINPYLKGVSASGLVEASSRNVEIAAPEPGLVVKVLVKPNDPVKAGDPLFQLDARRMQSQLLTAEAELKVAHAKFARLKAMPRDVDVAPLRNAVERARVELADAKDRLKGAEQAYAGRAATDREIARSRFAVQGGEALVAEAQAILARAEAGAWEQDLAVGQAEIVGAEAHIAALTAEIERLTVRAPISGVVLKSNVDEGEFTGATQVRPAMVLGDIAMLHIRVMVDEIDAPLVGDNSPAVARVRGLQLPEIPLTMVRVEPLAQPKRQFTGDPSEMVDARVVEFIFRAAPPSTVKLYPGQMVDVFINVE